MISRLFKEQVGLQKLSEGLLHEFQRSEISTLQGFIRYNKCKGKGIKALKPLHFKAGA